MLPAPPETYPGTCREATEETTMDAKSIRAALRDIGLTLNACHNTIATDRLDAEPDETSWRIDHSREIALVHDLERETAPSGKSP